MSDSDWSDLRDLYDAAEVVVRDGQGPWCAAEEAVRKRGRRACIITAWNPGRERPSHAENERANRRLGRTLALQGVELWPAEGRSMDGAFREPGFCVWDPDMDAMLAIGRAFGQLAVYVLQADGTRVTIACDDSPD